MRQVSRSSSPNGSVFRSKPCGSIAGDTDRVTVGGGAHSGRGMRLGSIVIKKSSDDVIEKAMKIAEHLLETSAADIEFKDGRFTVKGTNHSIGLFDVARAAAERRDLPADLQGPLDAECDKTVAEASFPYGCQVARSKSIRRPAPSSSSTTPRSTMSAAPSIR